MLEVDVHYLIYGRRERFVKAARLTVIPKCRYENVYGTNSSLLLIVMPHLNAHLLNGCNTAFNHAGMKNGGGYENFLYIINYGRMLKTIYGNASYQTTSAHCWHEGGM